MPELKKTKLEKWPLMAGDYLLGNSSESPVVVVTLASNLELDRGSFALAGGMRTENLGVERIVTNVLANPNVRFVILCGEESKGHMAGQALLSLWKNGVDGKGRITGAKGAFPYVENVPREAIERFRKQVGLVDMIGELDAGVVGRKCAELSSKDPGSFGEPFLFVEIEREEEKMAASAEGSLLVCGDVLYDYNANLVFVRGGGGSVEGGGSSAEGGGGSEDKRGD